MSNADSVIFRAHFTQNPLSVIRNASSVLLTGSLCERACEQLCFPQIEKLAQALSCDYNQPSPEVVSVADSSPTSSPPAKKCSKAQAQARWQWSAKKALLQWAQEQCAG